MAAAFRDTQNAVASSGTTVVVTKPTGTVDGDLLFAFLASSSTSSPTWSAPAGWTQIDAINTTTAAHATFYKIAASEGASYTFTLSQTITNATGIVSAFSGVDPTPLDTHSVVNNTSTAATAVATSITPTVNNCLIIYCANNNSTKTYTPYTGFTEPTNGEIASGVRSSEVSYMLDQGTAAATGAVAATLSASATSRVFLAAFKPATATGATANFAVASATTASPAQSATGGAQMTAAVATATTASPAMTATGVVSGAFAHIGTTNATSTTSPVTVTPTSGIVDGDLLFAIAMSRGTSPVVSPPTGWTEIDRNQGSAVSRVTFYKIAASESGNYAFTSTGSPSRLAAIVMVFRGSTATPLDVSSFNFGSSSTNVTATGVTTTAANDLVIFAASSGTGQAVTPPSGYTEPTNGDIANSTIALEVSYLLDAGAAGATGDVIGTTSPAALVSAFLTTFKVAATPATATLAVASATTASPAQSATGGSKLTAAVASANVASPAQSATGGSKLTAAVATANVASPVMTAPAGSKLTAVVASATAASPSAAIAGGSQATLALASATTASPAATAIGVIAAALALASATAASPALTATAGSAAALAIASATAASPAVVVTGGASAALVIATVTGASPALSVQTIAVATLAVASATISAGDAVVTGGAAATLVIATATAESPAVMMAIGSAATFPIATAAADSPAMATEATIEAFLAVATAAADAPALDAFGDAVAPLSWFATAGDSPEITVLAGVAVTFDAAVVTTDSPPLVTEIGVDAVLTVAIVTGDAPAIEALADAVMLADLATAVGDVPSFVVAIPSEALFVATTAMARSPDAVVAGGFLAVASFVPATSTAASPAMTVVALMIIPLGDVVGDLVAGPLFAGVLAPEHLLTGAVRLAPLMTAALAAEPILTATLTVHAFLTGTLEVGEMAEPLYAGTTKAIRLMDLLFKPADPDNPNAPVTTIGVNESIAISLIDRSGTVVVPAIAADNGGSGDDWYVTMTLPAAGRYQARAEVRKSGAVELFYAPVIVKAAPG